METRKGFDDWIWVGEQPWKSQSEKFQPLSVLRQARSDIVNQFVMLVKLLIVNLTFFNVLYKLVIAFGTVPPNFCLAFCAIDSVNPFILTLKVKCVATMSTRMSVDPFRICYEKGAPFAFHDIFLTNIFNGLLVERLSTSVAYCRAHLFLMHHLIVDLFDTDLADPSIIWHSEQWWILRLW